MQFFAILLLTFFVSSAVVETKKAKLDYDKKRWEKTKPEKYSKGKSAGKSIPNTNAKIKTHTGMSSESKMSFDFQKKCQSAVPNNFSPAQTAQYCAGAVNPASLSCVKDSRSGNVKLSFEEILSLCQGATSNYPLECYKALSSKDRKTYGLQLCQDASSLLPLSCWRKITTIHGLVRKVDPVDTVLFCTGVASNTQIDCVYSALKVKRMSFDKSIAECKENEVAEKQEHVTSAAIPSVQVDDEAYELCEGRMSGATDWTSRDADVLCGQAGSKKQVTEILQCAIDVNKLKVMTAFETARVCRFAGWVEEQSNYYSDSTTHGADHRSQRGRVASCVHKAFKEITTSSSARTAPDVELVIEACHSVSTASTGSCIASFSNRKLQDTITTQALLNLCTSRYGLSKLSCLKKQQASRPTRSRGPITPAEVLTCTSMASEVQTLRIIEFESLTGDPHVIVAGKFFSMTFEMIDQWGDVMSESDQEFMRFTVEVERSHQNDPGAVLFGSRTNTSESGKITFGHLMVSQPGPIQLKVTATLKDSASSEARLQSVSPSRGLLLKFLVHVSENPEMVISNHCLFVFKVIQSPGALTQLEADSWNDVSATTVIGRVPSARLMEVLSCLPVFESWAVTVHISPLMSATSGPIIDVHYRSGIEAVWTGHGLPRSEMTPYERLGVPVGCTNLKQIRSAYHKQSLKWHPDRWSGIFRSVARTYQSASVGREGATADELLLLEGGASALYKLAVQEAFELVAEGYEELLSSVG